MSLLKTSQHLHRTALTDLPWHLIGQSYVRKLGQSCWFTDQLGRALVPWGAQPRKGRGRKLRLCEVGEEGNGSRWAKQCLCFHPRSPCPTWNQRTLAYWLGHRASGIVSSGKKTVQSWGQRSCRFTCYRRFRIKSSLWCEPFGKSCRTDISNYQQTLQLLSFPLCSQFLLLPILF